MFSMDSLMHQNTGYYFTFEWLQENTCFALITWKHLAYKTKNIYTLRCFLCCKYIEDMQGRFGAVWSVHLMPTKFCGYDII